MTCFSPNKRPNCREILERKHLWALDEKEFEINDKLIAFIESKVFEENFTVYSMLELKLKLYITKNMFAKNDYFKNKFGEIQELGKGSFGKVVKANKIEENQIFAVKIIEIESENKNEIIKEFMNYSLIHELRLRNECLVKCIQIWCEESSNFQNLVTVYIQMELCDKTLDDFVQEIDLDSNLKLNGVLTTIGYYIASEIFIEILEGVHYLHRKLGRCLVHGGLKPSNILLKMHSKGELFVKIAEFGFSAIHEFVEQSSPIPENEYTPTGDIDFELYVGNSQTDTYGLAIILQTLFSLKINE